MIILEQGHAISKGERVIGTFSISAPIQDHFRQVIAAISLMIPAVRVDESKIDAYISYVKHAARMISQD